MDKEVDVQRLMKDEEFETKLRALCIAYDNENKAYPESVYEGLSLFEFFMEEGVGEIPEFNGEFLKDRWNAVLDGWKAGRLGYPD